MLIAAILNCLFFSSALALAQMPISASEIEGIWSSKNNKDYFVIHRAGNELTLSATKAGIGNVIIWNTGWVPFQMDVNSPIGEVHFKRRSSLFEVQHMKLDDPENGPPNASQIIAMAKAGLFCEMSGTLSRATESSLLMHVRMTYWHVHWIKNGAWDIQSPRSAEEDFYHESSHISLDANILFDFDRDELKPGADAVLSDVKRTTIDKHQGARLLIEGYTDDIGSDAYNLALSTRRAQSVAKWMALHGIAPSRIETKGYGKSRPAVPNTNDQNRARNRRVEITVLANQSTK